MSATERPYLVIRLETDEPPPIVMCAACGEEGPLGAWLVQPLQSRLLVVADTESPLTGAALSICATCDPGWPNRAEVEASVLYALQRRPS